MKILKVLGAVVGIHICALMAIFAIPGCSSSSKPAPAPVDTLARAEPAPSVTATGVAPSVNVAMNGSPVSSPPVNFNPDAPALAPGSSGVRFNPTRPNTSAAATLVTEPVTDVTPASKYTVKTGDSLWSLAKNNKITVPELAAANNLKTTATLHNGQNLIIPAKKATPVAATTTSATPAPGATAKTGETPASKAPADSVKHTVKTGESLSSIAKNYGVKQGDIAVANNITDPQKIYAGMVLVIPGWQNPAGKSAAKSSSKAGATTSAPAAKAPVPEIKPLFNAPVISPADGTSSRPNEVPVIKVDETPADAKPKN